MRGRHELRELARSRGFWGSGGWSAAGAGCRALRVRSGRAELQKEAHVGGSAETAGRHVLSVADVLTRPWARRRMAPGLCVPLETLGGASGSHDLDQRGRPAGRRRSQRVHRGPSRRDDQRGLRSPAGFRRGPSGHPCAATAVTAAFLSNSHGSPFAPPDRSTPEPSSVSRAASPFWKDQRGASPRPLEPPIRGR